MHSVTGTWQAWLPIVTTHVFHALAEGAMEDQEAGWKVGLTEGVTERQDNDTEHGEFVGCKDGTELGKFCLLGGWLNESIGAATTMTTCAHTKQDVLGTHHEETIK